MYRSLTDPLRSPKKDDCLYFVEFYDLIKFDGLWIDMNEPANFVAGDLNKGCADNKLNFPDYTPHVSY